MKRLIAAIILNLLIFASPAQAAPAYAISNFTTGRDWVEKMSSGEKFISLFAPSAIFYRYGVRMRHTPVEYIRIIDKLLEFNPQLLKEDVANIFASTVYHFEPQTRPAFDRIEIEFLRGNLDPVEPHLRIRGSLKEFSAD